MTIPKMFASQDDSLRNAQSAADALVGEWLPTGNDIDLKLIQRCAARDCDALREIVERYQRMVIGYLSRMLGSAEDAEEAAQDVFLRVWQQAGRFEKRASVATWMYRIATHAAYDVLRRRQALRRTMPLAETVVYSPDAQVQALADLERQERSQHLQCALQALRPQDRTLLILYYQEEMNYQEICTIMGCAYPVVKVRLLRARQRLRAALEPLTQEDTE